MKSKEFTINKHKWKVELKPEEELLEHYNKETRTNDSYSCLGLTLYKKHEIWIAQEVCYDERIRVLKHELTHCYIWEMGFYHLNDVNEELICDFVATIYDFINDILTQLNL